MNAVERGCMPVAPKCSLASCAFSIVLLTSVLLSGQALAEWSLTGANFETSRVELKAIGEAGVRVEAQGQQTTVPFSRFLMLERSTAPLPPPGALALHLHSGQKIVGEPRQLDDQTLVWASPVLGELRIGIDDAKFIAQVGESVRDDAPPELQDVVALINRDTLRGVLAEISATAAAIQTPQGEIIHVPLGAIRTLAFATPAGPRPRTADAPFRVQIDDGSQILASAIALRNGVLSFTFADAQRAVPVERITLIEQQNGPVLWLSSVTPTENLHRPFLSVSWPTRMNANVAGEPIRFGQQVYRRGIGVHSYSRLTFEIPPGYTRFRTRYAIDGERPYADVTVRVMLDGRLVHEAASFRAGVLSPVVEIALDEARTITLEVDYGLGYDVQDRLNWIEPALLR